MAWLYVPEVEVLRSASAFSLEMAMDRWTITEPFVMSRGKPMRPQSLSRKWKRDSFIQRLSGLTLEPSMVEFGIKKWISSLPDSPASRFQSQDQTSEPKIQGTSGLTLPESSAKYDPASSSWKTSQVSLFTQERLSLATWPKWGMIRRGVLFELPMPERITAARGGFARRSVPTPTLPGGGAGKDPNNPRGIYQGHPLQTFVLHFPTPTVHHAKRGNHDEDPQEFLKRAEEYRSKTGGTIGMSLGVAARLYPTPTAKANQTSPSMIQKIPAFREMWPTPDASPHKARLQGDSQQSRSLPALAATGKLEQSPGRLNPAWVEWLMGWPIGWTDCDSSETESSPSKQL